MDTKAPNTTGTSYNTGDATPRAATANLNAGQTAGAKAKESDGIGLDSVRENVSRLTSEFRQQAGKMAQDVNDRANSAYGEANAWLQENYPRALMVVGVLAAAGLVGYMLAKRDRKATDRT